MDIQISNKEIRRNVVERKVALLKENQMVDESLMILEKDLLHARVFLSENCNLRTLTIYENILYKDGYQDIFLCVPKENKKLIKKLSDNVSLGEDVDSKYLIFISEDINKHENFKK